LEFDFIPPSTLHIPASGARKKHSSCPATLYALSLDYPAVRPPTARSGIYPMPPAGPARTKDKA